MAVIEDLIQQMRDQDAACATGNDPTDKRQELAGGAAVERGGRLVQHDKPQWVCGGGKGTGHLHHLALADGQIADHVCRPDTVPGKNFVQLGPNEIAGSLVPAHALYLSM